MEGTLYEIKAEYLKALNNLEVNEDGEILNFEELEAAQTNFNDKIEAVALYIKELNAKADAVKDEMKKLKERADSYSNKADRLKEYLKQNMEDAQLNKFETSKCALSFRKSVVVNIDDEFAIPEKYLKKEVKETPNKDAIKKAIQAGDMVAGCSLLEKNNLQIK